MVSFEDSPLLEPYENTLWLKRGYAYLSRLSNVSVHRLIIGTRADGFVVDHINRDKLDCTRSNLRLATRTQNNVNTPGKNGKVKGVHFRPDRKSKPWHAQAKMDGKNKHLGYFATQKEAAQAYDIFVKRLHGDYAFLNGDYIGKK